MFRINISPLKCVWNYTILGTGTLPGKIWLVKIIENNKTNAYFRSGWVA